MEKVQPEADWGGMTTGEKWHPATIVHFTDPMQVRIPTGKTERAGGPGHWGGYYDVVETSGVPVKAIAILDDGRVWDVPLNRVRVEQPHD